MSDIGWANRKTRLCSLLQSGGDDDEEGVALDRLLHGASVIGKTSKTKEVDSLRFTDKDLQLMGTLEYGTFGVVDVVNCKCDGRVYVRKAIEKHFALRNSEQCYPQVERDLLLRALKHDSRWAPHLLCAYQSPTHLNLVMDYAEGGTLWDVLESSPLETKIAEADVQWWAPQIVSAIHWCHSQGFVHRDIKPQNFVLTSSSHVQLIDFGSAAPLLPPRPDGSQLVPKRYCLVPCGTCDYISPEILQAHEQALVALDMDSDVDRSRRRSESEGDGYGRETDWWSFGVMVYEMVYGVVPFFANDIRATYLRIMDHRASLRFNKSVPVSQGLQNLLRGLLTDASGRLGRHSISDITNHPFFGGTDWADLHAHEPPEDLHLPQYTYANPADANANSPGDPDGSPSRSHSQGFAFSALFQSSAMSVEQEQAQDSPGLSILHATPAQRLSKSRSSASTGERAVAAFIGFSWGPRADAFPDAPHADSDMDVCAPGHVHVRAGVPHMGTPRANAVTLASPGQPFVTPMRRASQAQPRSTLRKTDSRRPVSDREAMKQLLEAVGRSAHKKVLESGRKPRALGLGMPSTLGLGRARAGSLRKELRFDVTPRAGQGSLSMSGGVLGDADLSSLEDDFSGTDGPPSPSPSPRPTSALARSRSPTLTLTLDSVRSAALRRMSTGSTQTPTTSGPVNRRERAGTSVSLGDGELDGMERRHGELLRRIASIQSRLEALRQMD
ncbi:kinase-like protein [Heliocybe sulcata]|uniref:Kinase-like protein n=1 Tax=Heliocybe sulcata TaxID=5364 RepID=A0A5C3MPN6_9AGAM|nr:kinase-like protein [Heliocybe sulcata]